MSKSSSKPALSRHEQVSTWLRTEIEEGRYEVHEQLPSEHQLGEQFGVSRITVRRALQTLESDGMIYRRQGLGSFVQDTRVGQGLVRLTDFVEDMTQAGLEPSSQVTFQGLVEAPVDVAGMLDLEPGIKVLQLDRLRLADGEPIAFDRTWLPVFYAQLLDGHDLQTCTIYSILEQRYSIPIVSGRYRIEAVNAPADIAELLVIPEGRALLMIARLSETHGNRNVYYQRRFYRSDRIAYDLSLERDPKRPRSGHGLPLRDFEPVYKKPAYKTSAEK